MNPPQHIQALKLANRVRLAQAEAKRSVATGNSSVTKVLDPKREIPELLRSLSLFDLLRSQWRWGLRRSCKFLWRVGISESRTIGELTTRQRWLVIAELAKTNGTPPRKD